MRCYKALFRLIGVYLGYAHGRWALLRGCKDDPEGRYGVTLVFVGLRTWPLLPVIRKARTTARTEGLTARVRLRFRYEHALTNC
jgi:hypothetical protein